MSTSIDSFASRALCSAFATADESVFSICFAACFLEKLQQRERFVHVLAADLIDHEAHLVRRLARRCAESRARAALSRCGAAAMLLATLRRHAPRLLVGRLVARVATEQPRRRELAELVPDHVLRHVHRDELVPLCTAKVCPTKSGIIVLARDHVFTTFFSLRLFIRRLFAMSESCTNGPFCTLRPIFRSSSAVMTAWPCRGDGRGRSAASTPSSCGASSRLPSCPTARRRCVRRAYDHHAGDRPGS